jgi:ABC-type antimicrobial peptide transport system permease subunit
MPYEQAPDFNYLSLAIRTAGDPLSLVGPVKNILRDMDPQIPLASPRVMEDLVGASVARPQMTSALMGAFAALAALLSAVGLYGVIAFSVSGRTREIGIRVAVGAGRSDVLGLVVRQGMGLAATGLVLGLIGSLLAGQLLEGLLFSVSPRDPLVLVGSLTLLAAVAFVACLVPAMKAAGIHPREALTAD